MKKPSLAVVIFLCCTFSGCLEKKEKSYQQSGYKTYSVAQKPLVFRYPEGIFDVSYYGPDKKSSSEDPIAWISLHKNLHWNPWNKEQKEPEGDLDAVADWDLNIRFYDDTKGLEEEQRKFLFLYERVEEVMINNIPMLRLTNTYDPEGRPNQYIPLIPGEYISVIFYLTIEPDDQLFQQRANRLNQEIIQSLTWRKPIDTNTQEFKQWKERILGILKSGKTKK